MIPSKLEKVMIWKDWYFHRGDSLKWRIQWRMIAIGIIYWAIQQDMSLIHYTQTNTDSCGFVRTCGLNTSVTSKWWPCQSVWLAPCEVYIDGKYLYLSGKTWFERTKRSFRLYGETQTVSVLFYRTRAHTIAFRVSNFSKKKNKPIIHFGSNIDCSIFVEINRLDEEIKGLTDSANEASILIFAGIFITLTLFHFVLFLYYRKNRTNLYITVYLLFYCSVSFSKLSNYQWCWLDDYTTNCIDCNLRGF